MTDKHTPQPVNGETENKDLVKRLDVLAKSQPESPAGRLAKKQGKLLQAFGGY